MPPSIVIPDQLKHILEVLDKGDPASIYSELSSCSQRSILFYEENVVGFIVHLVDSTDLKEQHEAAYLTVQSQHNAESHNEAKMFLSKDEINSVGAKHDTHLDIHSAIIQTPILRKRFTSDSNNEVSLTVWKFEAPVGYPRSDLGGSITFKVTLEKPHLKHTTLSASGKEENENDRDAMSQVASRGENLFEQLNLSVSKENRSSFFFSRHSLQLNHESDRADSLESEENISQIGGGESCSLTLTTSLPLVLKLRSTKPGGRNDILLTTLSIEASSEMVNVAKKSPNCNYFLNILSLEAVLKGGTATELGNFLFPCLCSINDVINITYKLVNSEQLEQLKQDISELAKTLQIKLKVVMEKQDALSGELTCASNEITTMWTPILNFGLISHPINHSKKANPSYFLVQTQFEPLSNESKHPLGNGLKKSVTISDVINIAKPLPSIDTLRAPSPNPTRMFHTSASSPILPMNRNGGHVSRKFPKNMISASGTLLSVTLNLASTTNSSLSGLKLVFIGDLIIELGKVVTWKVQAINKSGRQLNLSLMVKNLKRLTAASLYGISSGSGLASSSSNVLSADDDKLKVNVSVHSRTQLHHQYNQLKLEQGGVVFLTNDVRLGPIEPNQVFESEILLIGISSGIYNLDGLRVFDMNTGDGIDFGRLLEVFII